MSQIPPKKPGINQTERPRAPQAGNNPNVTQGDTSSSSPRAKIGEGKQDADPNKVKKSLTDRAAHTQGPDNT